MSYFTESSYCSIEEHIGSLEDLYVECFLEGINRNTLVEIRQQIQRLEKKLSGKKQAEATGYGLLNNSRSGDCTLPGAENRSR